MKPMPTPDLAGEEILDCQSARNTDQLPASNFDQGRTVI
jgi:hypothetical protein